MSLCVASSGISGLLAFLGLITSLEKEATGVLVLRTGEVALEAGGERIMLEVFWMEWIEEEERVVSAKTAGK